MADLQPFRGIRYRPQHVPNLADVLCPPFDRVTGQERYRYFLRHPYNAVRLEIGQDDPADTPQHNRHTRAGATLREWLEADVLREDAMPGLYLYEQEFRGRVRRGLWGLVRLDDAIASPQPLDADKVQERLEHLHGTHAHFSPAIALYEDPDQLVTEVVLEVTGETPPFLAVTDEAGEVHRLWRLTDAERIASLQEALAPVALTLMDGRQRHAAAVALRDRLDRHGADPERGLHHYMPMVLVDQDDPGLLIEPLHRLVKVSLPEDFRDRLAQRYTVTTHTLDRDLPFPEQVESWLVGFMERGPGRFAVAVADELALHELVPLEASDALELDAERLQRDVLIGLFGLGPVALADPAVTATASEPRDVLIGLGSGRFNVAFFLPPPAPEAIAHMASRGVTWPPRTAQLVPVVPAGLVGASLEGSLPES